MAKSFSKITTFIAICSLAIIIAGCGKSWFVGGSKPVSIIYDTDMGTDIDDAGALAILHVLADKGEAKILATISANRNPVSAAAIDVINTYYGRPDLPIGSSRTAPGDELWYHASVPNYPHDLKSGNDAPEAVSLYRKILAKQPNNSVTIAVVGWLTNMAGLLDSPADKYSPLNGEELVAAKVKELVVMGGGIWPGPAEGNDYNFKKDGPAACKVINQWPGEIVFVGLGMKVKNGYRLVTEADESNPVRAFYKTLFDACNVKGRESWDLVSVLYAVRGLDDYFTAGSDGYITAEPDGSNQWIPGQQKKKHSYLIHKMPPDELADLIENLLLAPPHHPRNN